MSFTHSTAPFFSGPDVYRLIERIADRRSLVIYAGAGVTIDRTGLSWPDLVERLLKKHKTNVRVREAIMATNTPLQAGSIVTQLYVNRSDDWRVELGNDIRGLLYEGRAWRQGMLATEMVKLVAALADHGKDYAIVTTNYDEFIQQEMEILARYRERCGLPAIVLGTAVVEPSRPKAELGVCGDIAPKQIVHLHGFVPNNAREATHVVLSERDYMSSYARSSAVLEKLFSEHSVIIIGSSLTDPPLLSALANTVPAENEDRVRVAVAPLQGMNFPPDSQAFVEDVKNSVANRMASFGVRAVFPDFFYQAAQFLAEVRNTLDRRAPALVAPFAASPGRYGQRLAGWWTAWRGRREGVEYERQQVDHELLCGALERIREKLDISLREKVKLEIWIRWEPAGQARMRLWASTTSLWRSLELMRSADITADSKYTSVQTFCLGRPSLHRTDDERWKTYLCVPVRGDGPQVDLPVAVISLASMDAGRWTRINESNGSLIRRVIFEEMKPVASSIIAA